MSLVPRRFRTQQPLPNDSSAVRSVHWPNHTWRSRYFTFGRNQDLRWLQFNRQRQESKQKQTLVEWVLVERHWESRRLGTTMNLSDLVAILRFFLVFWIIRQNSPIQRSGGWSSFMFNGGEDWSFCIKSRYAQGQNMLGLAWKNRQLVGQLHAGCGCATRVVRKLTYAEEHLL